MELTRELWLDNQKNTYLGVGFGETSRALDKHEERFFKTLEYIKASDIVLDLGSNDGSFTQVLNSRSAGAVGVDFPEIAARSQAAYPHLKFIGEEISKLEFEDESFNAIVALGLVEHIVDDVTLFTKCRKWLKSEGRLLLTTPLSPEKIVEEDATHIRFYPPYSLLRLMELCGFKVTDIHIFREVDEYLIVGEVP